MDYFDKTLIYIFVYKTSSVNNNANNSVQCKCEEVHKGAYSPYWKKRRPNLENPTV